MEKFPLNGALCRDKIEPSTVYTQALLSVSVRVCLGEKHGLGRAHGLKPQADPQDR